MAHDLLRLIGGPIDGTAVLPWSPRGSRPLAASYNLAGDVVPRTQTGNGCELRELHHAKLLFTAAELTKLRKFAVWAEDLDSGRVAPLTPRQEHFVAVCWGEVEPQTDFEFLWLRYKQVVELDERIEELQREESRLQHHAEFVRQQLSLNKSTVSEMGQEIRNLKQKITAYEHRLGIKVTSSAAGPRVIGRRDEMEKYSSSTPESWREQK